MLRSDIDTVYIYIVRSFYLCLSAWLSNVQFFRDDIVFSRALVACSFSRNIDRFISADTTLSLSFCSFATWIFSTVSFHRGGGTVETLLIPWTIHRSGIKFIPSIPSLIIHLRTKIFRIDHETDQWSTDRSISTSSISNDPPISMLSLSRG